MRIELRDGQWAELRERISHGAEKALKKAALAAAKSDEAKFDWQTEVVRAFTREWSVVDPDGQAIDLDAGDAIERAPDDIVEAIWDMASDLYTGATVPNSPTPPSSGGSSSVTE